MLHQLHHGRIPAIRGADADPMIRPSRKWGVTDALPNRYVEFRA